MAGDGPTRDADRLQACHRGDVARRQEAHVPNEVPPEYETPTIDFRLRRVYEGMARGAGGAAALSCHRRSSMAIPGVNQSGRGVTVAPRLGALHGLRYRQHNCRAQEGRRL
jgi:hypothetical protein